MPTVVTTIEVSHPEDTWKRLREDPRALGVFMASVITQRMSDSNDRESLELRFGIKIKQVTVVHDDT